MAITARRFNRFLGGAVYLTGLFEAEELLDMPALRKTGPVAGSARTPKAERWLRGRMRTEMLFNLLESSMFAVFGIITLAVTSYISAFFLFFVLLHAKALFFLIGSEANPLQRKFFMPVLLLIITLSFTGAWKTRWGMDYSGVKIGYGSPVSGNLLRGLTVLICEILFSGPRLLFTSFESLNKALQLRALDIPQVTGIILWLFDKAGKASSMEIASVFPLNCVRILPQLRHLPGIIWLADRRGVVLLSEDFRRDLAEAIKPEARSGDAPGDPPTGQRHRDVQPVVFDEEICGWYETLELPPFASIQEVKKKYRQLVRIHHPDMKSESREAGESDGDQQIKRVNAAYHKILKHSRDSVAE